MRTALFLLVFTATANAHWSDWDARRETDPHGRYYVVLRYDGPTGGMRYTLARIGKDAPPVEPVEYGPWLAFGKWSIEKGVRDGDTVLTTGGTTWLSSRVIVSATGLGMLGIGEYYGTKHLTLVPSNGGPIRRLGVRDVFTHAIAGEIDTLCPMVWWLRGAWIDDETRRVVVVACDGRIRTVPFGDGDVLFGGDEEIVRALDLPYVAARTLALELVAERRIAAAKAGAKRRFADETEPAANRLRAALAIAVLGDPDGKRHVIEQAEARVPFAIGHLPDVLGEKAIPELIEVISESKSQKRRHYWDGMLAARAALARIGAAAVPALIGKVRDEANWLAAEVLVQIGDRRAILPLLTAGFADEAIDLSDKEIAPELVDLLARGKGNPVIIAGFFRKVRYPPVVPYLEKALKLPGRQRKTILKALRFQTGKDYEAPKPEDGK